MHMSMQIAIGPFVAALIAWGSIFAVVELNLLKHINVRAFQLFGAFAVGSIALSILGINIPTLVPLALTIGGFAVALAIGYNQRRKASA